MAKPVRPIAQVFWKRVKKTTGCWYWTGSRRQPRGALGWGGYGVLCPKRGERHYAHRLSWELHYGPIPTGMNVLHACDVPHCVRPDHLFLGTQLDNMRDAAQKRRIR